jgi:hypothetical protein
MTDSNFLSVFVKTADTGKMRYNDNPITGWASFSFDSSYSHITLLKANGIVAGSTVTISSTTGDVPFLTDWFGTGGAISIATPLTLGNVYFDSGLPAIGAGLDTDGDGIPNYLDTDSDNDGCPDATE